MWVSPADIAVILESTVVENALSEGVTVGVSVRVDDEARVGANVSKQIMQKVGVGVGLDVA
jgi:hypothetical protein